MKTHERAISKTRDKISFLIQNRRRSKNSVQKTASSVQRRTKSFALSIKNSKKQQTNFTEHRKQRKNSKKKKKSVGKELDASLCCVLLIYSPLSLKIKCSRLREEGLPLRNEEDIEAFSEVVLSKTLKKKQTTF